MIQAIELQVISRLLTTQEESDITTLLSFDDSYFNAYAKEIKYIRSHYNKYNTVPSVFDFTAQFNDFTVVQVPESIEELKDKLYQYKRYLILLETFNKVKDLQEDDTDIAWQYLRAQCDKIESTTSRKEPMDIVHQSQERAEQVREFARKQRIPTGFDEIDKVMYGGLSTVEELLVLIARTNAGKSWICIKIAESAQKHGFKVAYYSPEMQAAYLATRFDTWREHFENSQLFTGNYTDKYMEYINNLPKDEAPVYVIEDSDFPDGVSVSVLDSFVKQHEIDLLIIDGISYMVDDQNSTTDYQKYKNISVGLFSLSKKHHCAVVLVVQSNREVRNKDDKGDSIPTLYNIEGSDHPGRVATQAFGIRQIFDKHILDIALLKSRMANNENPVFSYSWDINSGQIRYIEGGSDSVASNASMPDSVTIPPDSITFASSQSQSSDLMLLESANLDADDDSEEIVEF